MVDQLNASVFDYPCCDGGVAKRLGASLHSLSGPTVGRDKLKAGGQDFGPDGLVFVVIKGFLILFGLNKGKKFTIFILLFAFNIISLKKVVLSSPEYSPFVPVCFV